MIYIAAPYNDLSESVINKRMEAVYNMIYTLAIDKKHAITPLFMHEVVRRYKMEQSFDFWESYCFDILSRCDSMIVIMLDGWKDSRGVHSEIDYCKNNGIPISYLNVNI